ncbi:MAG: VanZ family protein [Lachnospiraceae bacterium]|nr:VanZ family protein [Lachnospiraceae bacterium]
MGKELFLTICKDMQEPVGYLPQGLMAGALFLLIFFVWSRAGRPLKPVKRTTLACQFLCVVYLVVLAELVYFSREPGSRAGVNLNLFGTWGDTVSSRGYVIENLLLFIPYGILVPGSIPFLRKSGRCILSAVFCSMAIELVQLATQRGYCQLDDVVMNVLGAVLGWFCYQMAAAFI